MGLLSTDGQGIKRQRLGLLGTALVISTALLSSAMPGSAQAVEVTDVLGRQVEVPDTPQRIVLGEGRLFYALGLLDKDDPFKRVVGWQNDMRLLDPHTYAAYAERFPHITDIPLIGQASEQSVSAEQILSLHPDLAIFSISGEGPTQHSPVADLLDQAGIPVLFIDFRVHPIEGVHTSMKALGEVLGKTQQAQEYLAFYDRSLQTIRDSVGTVEDDERPQVFLELLPRVWQAPGHTTGRSGMGDIIEAVGGHNIAADVVPGALGDVNVEYVLQADPDVYIATGNREPGLLLGADVSESDAQSSFKQVLERPEFRNLRAIREGHAHALWHDFYNSPYNILAIEAMARWIHPELFSEQDAEATREELNGFLPMPLEGTYWLDQPEHSPQS